MGVGVGAVAVAVEGRMCKGRALSVFGIIDYRYTRDKGYFKT
jgi:hypothetical protein